MSSQFRITDRKVDRPTCITITVERLHDDSPDLSWLDQTDDEMGEGFEATATERKADYGTGWHMVGVQAIASYLIPVGGGGASSIQTMTSAGLWGIESDSEPEYFVQVEDEQISEVRAMLDALGIDHENAEVRR